jgi:hypothetical protein
VPPSASRATARDEGTLGRGLGPVVQPVGHALAVGAKRRFRAQVLRARRAVAQQRARDTEGERSVLDGRHRGARA